MPRTDPEARLDLRNLMEGRVSDPRQWPFPFRAEDDKRPDLFEVEPEHFVRAVPDGLSKAVA